MKKNRKKINIIQCNVNICLFRIFIITGINYFSHIPIGNTLVLIIMMEGMWHNLFTFKIFNLFEDVLKTLMVFIGSFDDTLNQVINIFQVLVYLALTIHTRRCTLLPEIKLDNWAGSLNQWESYHCHSPSAVNTKFDL